MSMQTNAQLPNAIIKQLEKLITDANNAIKALKDTEVKNNTDAITDLTKTVKNNATEASKKTVYGDITIEAHQVAWGGGQVYLGHWMTDASNTITKSGYYPIGVCSINTLDREKKYTLIGQSKAANSITVNYRWYHENNNSIAPGDMPQSIIFVAWVKIR